MNPSDETLNVSHGTSELVNAFISSLILHPSSFILRSSLILRFSSRSSSASALNATTIAFAPYKFHLR
jgi:hypothetical protein